MYIRSLLQLRDKIKFPNSEYFIILFSKSLPWSPPPPFFTCIFLDKVNTVFKSVLWLKKIGWFLIGIDVLSYRNQQERKMAQVLRRTSGVGKPLVRRFATEVDPNLKKSEVFLPKVAGRDPHNGMKLDCVTHKNENSYVLQFLSSRS